MDNPNSIQWPLRGETKETASVHPIRLRLQRQCRLDLRDLLVGEGRGIERLHVFKDLGGAARADERGGDDLVAQHPGQGHLAERLTAPDRDLVERAHSPR